MDFFVACRKCLEDEGYEYLGDDRGLIFYKDKSGKVWGAGEESMAKYLKNKGYYDY